MIALKINNRYVELPPSAKITFRLNNPIFDDDGLIRGSYTFPFEFSGSDTSEINSVLLKNPDVVENIDGFNKQLADIFIEDVFYRRGNLFTQNLGSNKTSSYFIFGLRTLGDDFKTKRVRDIIAETIVIDDSPVAKKIYLKPSSAATTPYRIMVNGRDYEGSTLSALRDKINDDTTEPRAVATLVNSGNTPRGIAAPFLELAPYVAPDDPLSPLHVAPADDNGDSFYGFKWYCESFDMTGYYDGIVDSLGGYFSGDYPTEKIRFPFITNYDIYGEGAYFASVIGETPSLFNSIKQQPYVNAKTGSLIRNQPNHGATVNNPFQVKNLNSLQPFLRLRYVLDKIAEYFGFEYEGDWLDDADTNSILVDNTAPLDVPMDYIGSKKFVFWSRSFNLADLFPDIKVVDLFKALRDRYNLAIYLNEGNGKVRIQRRENIIKSILYHDVTGIASPAITIDNRRVTGIRLNAEKSETDKISVVDKYEVGTPESEIQSKISGLSGDINVTNILGVITDVHCPRVSQKAGEKFGLRFFYYKGITLSDGPTTDFTYPRASTHANNYQETFGGVNGIYEKFWKRWLNAQINRRVITQTWTLPFSAVLDLDFELKRRFDRNDYLIKSLEFTADQGFFKSVKVEIYTTS